MLEISPIRAFADNYIWSLRKPGGRLAAVVDPGDEAPVLAFLAREGLELGAILVTHHHADHTGGVRDLLAAFPGAPVFGPAGERIPAMSRPLREGDIVRLEGIDAQFTVWDVPGHTAGHIAYYEADARVLFCGDTLFAAGCGRVFGGTLHDLHASLQRIAGLPTDTLLYCAHEYTLDNLGFAQWVEPDNPDLPRREASERARRSRGEPTVPSALRLELATNPFLRVAREEVRQAAERYAGRALASDQEVFAVIRTWKDREYD